MEPIFAVTHQPDICRSLHLRDRVEQVGIQHLDPEILVEPLDPRILPELTRLDEQLSHAMPFDQSVKP